MSNKRHEVEAAIKKVVPEILELKFGVPVRLREWPHENGNGFVFVSFGMAGLYTVWSKTSSAVHVSPAQVEILGRPITLEDVLRAIEQTKYRYTFCMAEAVTSTPSAIYVYDFNEHIAMMPWVLGKPLSEQSDAVIDFLHSILV